MILLQVFVAFIFRCLDHLNTTYPQFIYAIVPFPLISSATCARTSNLLEASRSAKKKNCLTKDLEIKTKFSKFFPVSEVTLIYFRNSDEYRQKEYHQTCKMIYASATNQYLVWKKI